MSRYEALFCPKFSKLNQQTLSVQLFFQKSISSTPVFDFFSGIAHFSPYSQILERFVQGLHMKINYCEKS